MPLIAIDADGVMLDYHVAYRNAWFRAFGETPSLRDPLAYWPIDRWNVEHLSGSSLAKFRDQFDDEFWGSIPAYEGAVEACTRLQQAGFDLVCVTAVEERFLPLRKLNLQRCGFPIEQVFGTNSAAGALSPKASILESLKPIAFVDDFLPYFRGLVSGIHRALIIREPHGSPNIGPELSLVDSLHNDLSHFSEWLLQTGRKNHILSNDDSHFQTPLPFRETDAKNGL